MFAFWIYATYIITNAHNPKLISLLLHITGNGTNYQHQIIYSYCLLVVIIRIIIFSHCLSSTLTICCLFHYPNISLCLKHTLIHFKLLHITSRSGISLLVLYNNKYVYSSTINWYRIDVLLKDTFSYQVMELIQL